MAASRAVGPATGERGRSFGACAIGDPLNETLFFTIGQARAILARWVHDYNTERPHSSLGYATPAA